MSAEPREALAHFKRDITLMCAEMVATARRGAELPEGEFRDGYRQAQAELAAMLRMVARDEIPLDLCREVHRRADPPAEATPPQS